MEWQNVPTPEEIIDIGKKKIFGSGKHILWIVLGLIIIMGLKGVIYSIGPDEVGVIQRFGKYIGLSSPGLHVKAPFGIDRATPIKVEKIFKEEFGTRSLDRESRAVRSYGVDLEESLMLTGDLNILDVRWIVQFKIKGIKLIVVALSSSTFGHTEEIKYLDIEDAKRFDEALAGLEAYVYRISKGDDLEKKFETL